MDLCQGAPTVNEWFSAASQSFYEFFFLQGISADRLYGGGSLTVAFLNSVYRAVPISNPHIHRLAATLVAPNHNHNARTLSRHAAGVVVRTQPRRTRRDTNLARSERSRLAREERARDVVATATPLLAPLPKPGSVTLPTFPPPTTCPPLQLLAPDLRHPDRTQSSHDARVAARIQPRRPHSDPELACSDPELVAPAPPPEPPPPSSNSPPSAPVILRRSARVEHARIAATTTTPFPGTPPPPVPPPLPLNSPPRVPPSLPSNPVPLGPTVPPPGNPALSTQLPVAPWSERQEAYDAHVARARRRREGAAAADAARGEAAPSPHCERRWGHCSSNDPLLDINVPYGYAHVG